MEEMRSREVKLMRSPLGVQGRRSKGDEKIRSQGDVEARNHGGSEETPS